MNQSQMSQPLPLSAVSVSDSFWGEYQRKVIEQVIPYQWEALNDRIPEATKSYCMQNFRVAAGLEKGKFQGFVFQDSDFSKWIEAVGYALTIRPDAALEKTADQAIDLVVSAQQPDGYLDTYYIINGLEKRFTNLKDNHELYCFGHMLEGAIAYYQATGKDKLLQAMLRYADCVAAHFGTEPGKSQGYPGHEVAEMALMRLYAITGDEKHLKLAKYFVDQRGQAPLYFELENQKYGNAFPWENSPFQYQYYQAGKPVREQTAAEGHAVRAVYLFSGVTDVARLTGDEALYQAALRVWNNIVQKRMYITGGIGSSEYGESFTFDHDLPNDTVYAETCASIGLVFFARRMLEVQPNSSVADVMEKALYNGIISGMSLDGTSFFYVNPLEVVPQACREDHLRQHVKPTRQKWFGCACCPPNLARLIASLGTYACTVNTDTFYFHLYMGSHIQTDVAGTPLELDVQSGFPWNGSVRITVQTDVTCALALRIPGWCKSYTLLFNGNQVSVAIENGYAVLRRTWLRGDTLLLTFDMPATVMEANPAVREDAGKVAVMRGPLVYCLEEADNGGNLHLVRIPQSAKFHEVFEPDLLGGVVTLKTSGDKLVQNWPEDQLYRPADEPAYETKELTFIPYYAWANRAVGEMLVWVHQS